MRYPSSSACSNHRENLFGEAEVGVVRGAVCQLQNQLPAGPGPGSVRLPDITVHVRDRIISQPAAPSIDGVRDGKCGAGEITANLGRGGIAGSEYVQSLIAPQAESNRDCTSGPHAIEDGGILDRLEEAGPI